MSLLHRRRGITLVELMMVILIIGMLMSLLLTAVQGARESARRTQCLQKMRHIGDALLQFESAQTHFPGWKHYPFHAWEFTDEKKQPQEETQFKYATGWFPQLFQYLGRRDLLDPTIPLSWKRPLRVPPGGRNAISWTPRMHQFLVCPSDPSKMPSLSPLTSFIVNAGRRDAEVPDQFPNLQIPADWRANGLFLNLVDYRVNPNNKVAIVKQDSSYVRKGDGLSTTVMLSETLANRLWFRASSEPIAPVFIFDDPSPSGGWPNGTPGFSAPYAACVPTSNHPSGVNAVFADGHGRFVRTNIDYLVYCALMTPNGSAAMEPGSTKPSKPFITNQPKLTLEKL